LQISIFIFNAELIYRELILFYFSFFIKFPKGIILITELYKHTLIFDNNESAIFINLSSSYSFSSSSALSEMMKASDKYLKF
jgi:hypothetical protein